MKTSKNTGDDGGARFAIRLFIPAGYADSTLMASLHHLASSVPHDTTPLCSAESASLCNLLRHSRWGAGLSIMLESSDQPPKRSPKGLKNSCSSCEHSSQEITRAQKIFPWSCAAEELRQQMKEKLMLWVEMKDRGTPALSSRSFKRGCKVHSSCNQQVLLILPAALF